MRLAGAVLAGGQSRRMGRTKALIEVDGQPMARRVADVLAAAGASDVVLIGGDRAELGVLGLDVIDDQFPGEGPVGGVITALRRHRDATHVVIAACDLPSVNDAAVGRLVARISDDVDVVVAVTDRLEPALAVWSVDAVPRIEQAFSSGVRALHEVVGSLTVATVELEASTMLNVNRPGDLPDGSSFDQ